MTTKGHNLAVLKDGREDTISDVMMSGFDHERNPRFFRQKAVTDSKRASTVEPVLDERFRKRNPRFEREKFSREIHVS